MTQPYNDHYLAEQRSLAYHRVIAERLRQQPELLDKVRQRLLTQLSNPRSPAERYWAKLWLETVAQPLDDLLHFIVERSERADQLRQSSPFAGILQPAERWTIHRTVREQWLQEQHREQNSA